MEHVCAPSGRKAYPQVRAKASVEGAGKLVAKMNGLMDKILSAVGGWVGGRVDKQGDD